MSWHEWLAHQHAEIRARGRWRELRTFDGRGQLAQVEGGDGTLVSFASNDYLGLSAHPAVVAAAREALQRWGAGAGASRLVTGSRPVHDELEGRLAAWKHAQAALVFSTGFAANLGVLSALGTEGVSIFSDELNHASIVDGCRLSRAVVHVYRHGDLDHLEELLRRTPDRALVVSDAVFSMDGDLAPVAELVSVCDRHGALLVLDEAHAVLGPHLDGLPADAPVLRVGTLSKTLGALGGFVTGPRPWIELLVNRARPFIFTTALTPADAAAALAALGVLQSSSGAGLVERLRQHVDRVRPGHPSPIVPLVLGSEDRAAAAATQLLERGLLVPAIRPPSVPPGTSRLRITLSAAHTDTQVGHLVDALADLALLDRAPA